MTQEDEPEFIRGYTAEWVKRLTELAGRLYAERAAREAAEARIVELEQLEAAQREYIAKTERELAAAREDAEQLRAPGHSECKEELSGVLKRLEEWQNCGRSVGVSCPGAMQQARHMADAACKALKLEYEHTAPCDISEGIAALRARVAELEADPAQRDWMAMQASIAELEKELEERSTAQGMLERELAAALTLLRAAQKAGT